VPITKGKSIDACMMGVSSHCSDGILVMRMERRKCVITQWVELNGEERNLDGFWSSKIEKFDVGLL